MEPEQKARKGDGCAKLVALAIVGGILWWMQPDMWAELWRSMGPWRFLVVGIPFAWAAVLIGRLMFIANEVTNDAEAREKDTRK